MKKIKNISTQAIKRNGVRINPNSYYTVDEEEEKEWVSSQTFDDIDNNIIIINEDNVDLVDKTEMKRVIRRAYGKDRSIVRSMFDDCETNSSNYKLLSKFIFAGTDILGPDLYGKFIAKVSNGGTASIRLYCPKERTVLYEKTDITNSESVIINFDSLSNLSTSECVIEIQAKTNNASKVFDLNYFEIRW